MTSTCRRMPEARLLVLTLAGALLLASPAGAQERSADDMKAIDSYQVAMQSGRPGALPPGAARDNALLLEQNDPEIRKLTRTRAES